MNHDLLSLAEASKKAASSLRLVTTEQKNEALKEIAKALHKFRQEILEANLFDLEQAKKGSLDASFLDRLSLQTNRLDGVISDVENIAELPDPVGKILEKRKLKNGLRIQKLCVPIGVLGIIYESRPNVTVDVACLALKTSNAAILRGGKETFHTNCQLMLAIQSALDKLSLPKAALQLVQTTDRKSIEEMLKLDAYIDMIIPRGGKELHKLCREKSAIPVITGGIGICHLFVDESADLNKSLEVIFNAKTQRPSVCNALDTVLIHKNIATAFLSSLVSRLEAAGVMFRMDQKAYEIVANSNSEKFQRASEEDWKTEWLSLVLGIKIVDSLEKAVEHIQKYSSGHSDGILTENKKNADFFINAVDSSAVYVNASTRFTDGAQFDLGAEVAVSTQKLHARGPMGLEALTTYKWLVEGDYSIRQ